VVLRASTAILVLLGAPGLAEDARVLSDPRDGRTYRTVVIGTQTWMAENLNLETPDSWCYDNDEAHCAEYGRLYTWEAAKTACPSGWHLPSEEEWFTLERHLGMTDEEILIFYHRGEGQGTKLKSEEGWAPDEDTEPGSNETGFSALPGGHRVFYNGAFGALLQRGAWWSSTPDGKYAMRRAVYADKSGIDRDAATRTNAFSVRCVAD
jgi:uncharacterized protein (TIGR02145 family)